MKTFRSLVLYILLPAVVLFVMMTSIRLLMNPLFLTIEYNMPGFPPDAFGFTKDDRLHWANLSLKYLLNDADISFLGDLRFENGSQVFNERELRHMLDVKILVQQMIRAWGILGIFIFLTGVWAWRGRWLGEYWLTLSRAGWAILIVIGLILAGVMIGFSSLFTGFHLIFFEGDTWLFYYSDTLIRLFPLRFWQDAFTLMGILSAGGGIALILLGKRLFQKTITTQTSN
ncbi:TIGR01906 family membrane protein [Bellilinea sp.]|uniref:TIGR01906 family membrane protein n=1 Tax=Bellilinea caldifistulae TaxID=360411 RepID=A0A7C4Q2L8_9CHLR|nr:TIGR01906 family membrane protein [Bellilinea sp.]